MIDSMQGPETIKTGTRPLDRDHPWVPGILCVLPIALVAWAHYSLLTGGFYVDDYVNLYDAIHNGPLEFIFRIHAGHSLILRNGLFYVTYQLFGLDPFPYLASALAVHLTNVALLQRLLRHFDASPQRAALCATLWGVSPIAFGVIGWYSAACHAMLTTFVLWVLGDLARAARDHREIGWGTAIRWCLLLLAGASTFGAGIGLAVLSPLVAFLILPSGPSRNRAMLALGAMAAAVPLLYLLQQSAMGVLAGQPKDQIVAVSLSTAVGQSYEVLRTLVDFVGYGLASFLLGPWITADETGHVVSGSFAGRSAPWVIGIGNALFAIFGAALAMFVWKGPKERRRPMAAIGLLCIVAYLSIVIARLFWFKEHPAFALQPRYHYLGPALLAVLISFLLGWLGSFTMFSARVRSLSLVPFLILWTAFSVRTANDLSAVLYKDGVDEFTTLSSFLERRIDQAPARSPVFIKNRPLSGHEMYELLWSTDPARFPGLAAVFVILYSDDVVSGKHVHFVENDPARLEALRRRSDSRIARLVISPAEAQLRR